MESMTRFMSIPSKLSQSRNIKLNVAILTFYNAQKELIESGLRDKGFKGHIPVRTIDASQGL